MSLLTKVRQSFLFSLIFLLTSFRAANGEEALVRGSNLSGQKARSDVLRRGLLFSFNWPSVRREPNRQYAVELTSLFPYAKLTSLPYAAAPVPLELGVSSVASQSSDLRDLIAYSLKQQVTPGGTPIGFIGSGSDSCSSCTSTASCASCSACGGCSVC